MLKSFAVDALADFDEKKKFEPATVAQVETFLKEATGPVKEMPLTTGGRSGQQTLNQAPSQAERERRPALPAAQLTVRIFQCDQKTSLMIESRDAARPGVMIHKSYIKK